MAANKNIRIGPVALTTTLTTNILNPQTLTGGVSAGGTSNTQTYILIRHIRIANKTASAATFRCGLARQERTRPAPNSWGPGNPFLPTVTSIGTARCVLIRQISWSAALARPLR